MWTLLVNVLTDRCFHEDPALWTSSLSLASMWTLLVDVLIDHCFDVDPACKRPHWPLLPFGSSKRCVKFHYSTNVPFILSPFGTICQISHYTCWHVLYIQQCERNSTLKSNGIIPNFFPNWILNCHLSTHDIHLSEHKYSRRPKHVISNIQGVSSIASHTSESSSSSHKHNLVHLFSSWTTTIFSSTHQFRQSSIPLLTYTHSTSVY